MIVFKQNFFGREDDSPDADARNSPHSSPPSTDVDFELRLVSRWAQTMNATQVTTIATYRNSTLTSEDVIMGETQPVDSASASADLIMGRTAHGKSLSDEGDTTSM